MLSPLYDVTRKVFAGSNKAVAPLNAAALACCKVMVSKDRFRYDPYRVKVTEHRDYPTPKVVSKTPVSVAQPIAARRMVPPSPIQFSVVSPAAVVPEVSAPVAAATDSDRAPSVDSNQSASSSTKGEPVCRVSVAFKHTEELYVSNMALKVGDIITVVGDRGRDMGRVAAILPAQGPHIARVIGVATTEDKATMATMRQQEKGAMRLVQRRCDECGLRMKIEDAEFQLDGAKLTVFYTSKGPVDFRSLQRILFRDFRCRVWIRNMPGTY